ncbi:MAG: PorT family protein [Acidobacteriia bacterium]|nr:PorT family protein [Terriglobia bacterium]
MRLLFLLCSATAAVAQPLSVGVKAGLPWTDFLNTAQSGNFSFTSTTNRYIFGASAELRLPFHLSIELDALYRHFSYHGIGSIIGITTTTATSSTTSNDWEFPLLAKYRFGKKGVARPFVDAGVAFDTLQGLAQTVKTTVLATGSTTTSSTSNPPELNDTSSRGFVMGVGLDVKAVLIHIQPEIRYTRWGAKHFLDPNALLHSNPNQAEFLVGITF